MKTQIQQIDGSIRPTKLIPLMIVLCGTLVLGFRAQAQVPYAVKFLAPSPDVRIWSDGKGIYGDSETDVMALSVFNFSTHDNNGKKLSAAANRKMWVDLRMATLAPGTATPFTQLGSLPGGLFEGTMTLYAHNDELLNCVTTGQGLFTMAPGELDYRSHEIRFTDAQGGEWRLHFGRFVCGSPPPFSHCRLLLRGWDDLDGDGYADVWTIEPEPGRNSEAFLYKLNKRQQWDPWGAFAVPFKLVFAKEQFASVLDLFN